MMSAAAARPVQSLPRVELARAELANALLHLLSGEMDVRIAQAIPDMMAFVTEDGHAFAPLSVSGSSLLREDDDIDRVCAALDACDPLLEKMEGFLKVRFETVAVERSTNTAFSHDGAIVAEVSGTHGSVLIALEPSDTQRAEWIALAKVAKPDLSQIPVAFVLEFEAAKLAVGEAALIEGGDLLLLPRRASALWQAADDGRSSVATVELAAMAVTAAAIYDEKDDGMNDDDASDETVAFKVPVTIRLPVQYVDAAALAALRSGSSLMLGPLISGLAVELLVGGRRIGSGEIVEIGDNFAVLVDENEIPAKPAESHGQVDLADVARGGE